MQFNLGSRCRHVISFRRHLRVVCASKSTAKSQQTFPKAKKSYGQNFLKSSGTAWEIVQGANLRPGLQVLEIGPGTGVLTSELLKEDVRVTAIENDHALIDGLQGRFQEEISQGKLKLLQGDATRLDLRPVFQGSGAQPERWKVVANLPFNISTEILKILLPMGDIVSDVYVMLQAEAALRLSGEAAGDSSYRAMTALVEFYSTAKTMMFIDRTKFQPQPHVDCQMVNFKLKKEAERPRVTSEKAFLHVLKVSFGSRRKTVQNNLKAIFPAAEVSAALTQLNLDSNTRPQQLSAEDFAALSRILIP